MKEIKRNRKRNREINSNEKLNKAKIKYINKYREKKNINIMSKQSRNKGERNINIIS